MLLAFPSSSFATFCRISFSCIRHFSTSFIGTNKFNMAAARRSESRKLQKDREGVQFRSQFIQVVYVVLVISPSRFNCGYHSYSAP